MPHSAASDLGLHCLPMSFLWESWYNWVKICMSILPLVGVSKNYVDSIRCPMLQQIIWVYIISSVRSYALGNYGIKF